MPDAGHTRRGFALAIHGGAGTLRRGDMTAEREALYHAGLRLALRAGEAVLADGGNALDAVTVAVCALEDDPLFNAGRGAVFTRVGTQEMDAAVMDGRDRRAGAVAGVFGPRNPVLAARAVMERSPHVLLVGEGAMAFCREAGLAFADRGYFFTEARWEALQETLAQEAAGRTDGDESRRHGTVGAVARDSSGDLAAATSTGGMTGKFPGRIGDSPIIGTRSPPASFMPASRLSQPPRRSSPSWAESAAPAGSSPSAATATSHCRSTAPGCIAAT